ncbi:hypothetical protein PR202_ga09360 [Eleusine coracana subsp. coracana]|uniref:Uncharacterized protein n=1 Tax=Eleusine coracana subsp. coracana TaxID=191504 RepID=A0AAV5C432_ELECO|nr:hypothetical protein PR202_ga09360 [Eleusine coracana subsp. coracana]
MATHNLRVFLVFFLAQVCLLLAMAASAVQGSSRAGPVSVKSTPECCLYHPDCCEAGFGAGAATKP